MHCILHATLNTNACKVRLVLLLNSVLQRIDISRIWRHCATGGMLRVGPNPNENQRKPCVWDCLSATPIEIPKIYLCTSPEIHVVEIIHWRPSMQIMAELMNRCSIRVVRFPLTIQEILILLIGKVQWSDSPLIHCLLVDGKSYFLAKN